MNKPSKKLLDLALDITGERELEEYPKLLKLYTYTLDLEIEIERLNKGYCKFKEQCGKYAMCLRENQLKEIEKLNNIINELERDFERKIQSCTIEAETTTNDFYCRLHIATLKNWLSKIQELKGSDNNE